MKYTFPTHNRWCDKFAFILQWRYTVFDKIFRISHNNIQQFRPSFGDIQKVRSLKIPEFWQAVPPRLFSSTPLPPAPSAPPIPQGYIRFG